LARTATNIKVGAVSPLSGMFKCVLKLALAVMTTSILNIIPMACVGGILAYVAVNMVKAEEIGEVLRTKEVAPCVVMTLTAATVFLKDFLTGIMAGLLVYAIFAMVESYTNPAQEGLRYQLMRGESSPEVEATTYYAGGPDPLASGKVIPRNVTPASVDAASFP
jgi:MFS superfamily sulfate permease-like transporter